jgi:LysM repeat protein
LSLRSLFRTASALACCVGLLAGCASEAPAPISAAPPAPAAIARTQFITVRPGQSLGRIAQAYHVPAQAIIAANQLTPPYRLKAGARLVIPVGAVPPAERDAASAGGAASSSAHAARPIVTAKAAHPPARHAAREVIPLDDPPAKPAGAGAVGTAAAAPPPASTTAPRQGGKAREVIPLD